MDLPTPVANSYLDAVFSKNDEVITREIVDETLLVPIKGEMTDLQSIFALESTGAFFWQQLDGTTSVKQIVSLLLDEFEVERAELLQDLEQFISQLLKAQLILERES